MKFQCGSPYSVSWMRKAHLKHSRATVANHYSLMIPPVFPPPHSALRQVDIALGIVTLPAAADDTEYVAFHFYFASKKWFLKNVTNATKWNISTPQRCAVRSATFFIHNSASGSFPEALSFVDDMHRRNMNSFNLLRVPGPITKLYSSRYGIC